MLLYLIRMWLGPLPQEEIFPDRRVNRLLHWFIHPLKRRLAKYYLLLLKSLFGLKVIALTGSTGKTTTSNMLFSVFSQVGPTIKTADSVTTTYNLPTTILKCTPRTKYLILEMGVEYRGDMDFYTWLARPDIALLLNITSVHSTFLGSLPEIFAEKSKLLSALPPTGSAVINADDQAITYTNNSRVFRFGSSPGCYAQILSAQLTSDLHTVFRIKIAKVVHRYTLPTIGTHLGPNLAAALTVFRLLEIPQNVIKSGLARLPQPDHRLAVHIVPNGPVIIDDAYNANLLSTTASLENLLKIARLVKKQPVFIFAQMNELGTYEKVAHEKIGTLIKKHKIEHIFTLGKASVYTIRSAGKGRYYDTFEELSAAVKKFITPDHCVLIKGSNSWHLERLVPQLTT